MNKEERGQLRETVDSAELWGVDQHVTNETLYRLLGDLDLAEERIAELERENARTHQLYSLDRAEGNSRGGA